MDDLAQAIRDLPLEAWVPIAVMLIVGLGLWAAGRRLLPPGFAVLGLVAGGIGGWLLASNVNLGLAPWIVAIVAGIVLACVAALASKVAVAVGLGTIAAVLGASVIWSADVGGGVDPATILASPEPEFVTDDAPPDELDAWLETLGTDVDDAMDDAAGGEHTLAADIGEHLDAHLAEARSLGRRIGEQAQIAWDQAPPETHTRMLGAGLVGLLLGLIFGTLASSFSAALLTATGGAFLWMAGLWSAASRLGADAVSVLPSSPRAWLAWWLVLSVIGLCIQWTIRPRRADKRA